MIELTIDQKIKLLEVAQKMQENNLQGVSANYETLIGLLLEPLPQPQE